MKEPSRKKLYSLKRRIFYAFSFSYLLLLIFILIVGIFFYQTELRHAEEACSVLVSNSAKQMDHEISTIQNFVLTTMISHPDLTLLESGSDQSAFPQIQARFVNYMRDYTSSLTTASGVFFYLPRIRSFMYAVNKESSIPYRIREGLYDPDGNLLIREFRTTYRKWRFNTEKNELYLVKYLTYSKRIGGAWISFSTLASRYGPSGLYKGTLMLFASVDGSRYYLENTLLTDYSFVPENKHCRALYNGQETDYLQVSASLDHCEEQLVLLIPMENIRNDLRKYLDVGYAVFGSLLIVFILFYLTVRNTLSAPVNNLRQISSAFREGEADPEALERLQQDVRSIEVREITQGISDLVEQLSAVENRALMEEYAKNRFELQSLKNQVSPHFLINSLSSISSLSSVNADPALVKTLISLLASHLRYTMSSKTSVSISEEVRHLKDYYKMMQIRYPGSLSYDIRIQDLCDEASIFPSLILMLSENSVKHNLAVGELLNITVTASEEELNGEHIVRITHRDSGNGFDPDVLKQLNQLDKNAPETIKEGQNIGLYNIVRRLHLAYQDKQSAINFSNDENGGAVIEIIIPYIPYQES